MSGPRINHKPTLASDVNGHLVIHEPDQRFRCAHCGATFLTVMQFNTVECRSNR